MKAIVYTHRYEEVHGHRPRGRGNWTFLISRFMKGTEEIGFDDCYYSQAKTGAVEAAEAICFDVVEVMP